MSKERPTGKREGGSERKRIVRVKSSDSSSFADSPRGREGKSKAPYGTRPDSSTRDSGKPKKPYGTRPDAGGSDKSKRPYGTRPGGRPTDTDRPKRNFKGEDTRSTGRDERPKRAFDKRDGEREERPKRTFDKRDDARPDREERPKRTFDKREDARPGREERPKRTFDKRDDARPGREERPKRSFDKRDDSRPGRDERPKRSFDKGATRDDKPRSPKGGRPDEFFAKADKRKPLERVPEEKGNKRFADREERPRRTPERAERPERTETTRAVQPETPFDQRKEEVMPLNKFVAHCGITSRREAAGLIKDGKVKVNGEIMLEPGYKVQLTDKVEYGDKIITSQKNLVYILLNKPKNYLTTTEDPQDRKTVMELVADAGEERVYPVGRLDRNTSGLLLLTNDGELAQKLSHPKYNIKKVYQVTLNKILSKPHFDKIVEGITLEDGEVVVDAIAYLEDKNEVGLEIHSGRNRIVRRIFEHLGYEVEKLDRVMYAGLTKKNIPRGKWRFLNAQEVINLKYYKQ